MKYVVEINLTGFVDVEADTPSRARGDIEWLSAEDVLGLPGLGDLSVVVLGVKDAD